MMTDKKQMNFRADVQTRESIEQLIPVVSAALGIEVTLSDIMRLGVQSLKKQYLGEPKNKPGKSSRIA